MQRTWSADELSERWSLLPEDLALLAGRIDTGKLGFAVQLAFWRQHGRFPDEEADVAPAVIAHLAAQIGVGIDALDGYPWVGRSGRRHRVGVIDYLAVAAFDEVADARSRRRSARKLVAGPFRHRAHVTMNRHRASWPHRSPTRSPATLCLTLAEREFVLARRLGGEAAGANLPTTGKRCEVDALGRVRLLDERP